VVSGSAATSDYVGGCWIGIGSNGSSAAGNNQGVDISGGATGDLIGSTASGGANVIGDNTIGIAITNASYNLIYGNDVGLTSTFASAPNATGIEIANTGSNIRNTIGDDVIGDNTGNGILVTGSNCQSNYIQGCDIGVTYSSTGIIGYFGAPNGGDGILLSSGATSNFIGGTTTGAGNVIAGNSGNGVELNGSSGNTFQSNVIGEASHSIFTIHGVTTTYYPNGGYGVLLDNSSTGNYIGTGSFTNGNEISGNALAGILFEDGGSTGNYVEGDYIGTDSSGDPFGNSHEGILDFGGNEIITGNVLSDNAYSGISIPTNGNSLTNNLIGTNPAGNAALPNGTVGLYLNGYNNTISGNTISGNNGIGLNLVGSSGNGIDDNFIGTNSTGTAAIPNSQPGAMVTGSSNVFFGDVLSGNTGCGIALEGPGNTVEGCEIGTNLAGTAAIPNGREGVYVNSNGNLIGGTLILDRNIISGNTGGNASYGISLDTSGAYNNTVEGNYIGTASNGSSAIGNYDGVIVQEGAYNNSIGSTSLYGGNLISGNSNDGVFITSGATGTMVVNAFIGTDVSGQNAVSNAQNGVEILSANNTVGGTGLAHDLISGNQIGVLIKNTGSTGNIVAGDYLGTDSTGTKMIQNIVGLEYGTVGVAVGDGASGAVIENNLISGNTSRGVVLLGTSTTSSTVQGNLIGTDYTGLQSLGNGVGIYVSGDQSVIGGSTSAQGNTIDFNSDTAISLYGPAPVTVSYCTMYGNDDGAISNAGSLLLENDTITGNNNANYGGGYGGGIYNSGNLTIFDSTIDANTATGSGGGIESVAGSVFLVGTIVAQNIGGDITGAVTTNSSNNLIGDSTGLTGIGNGVNGNLIGTHASPINALLGPLANNGGTTETQAPEVGSPAYDAGIPTPLYTDQRGVSRPGSGSIDIGSVQHESNVVTINGATAVYLRLATDGQTLDVYYNNTGTGTPGATYLLSDVSNLSITGTSGTDQLTVDYSNGTPIPLTFSYDGLAGNNTMEVIGSNASDTMTFNMTSAIVNSSTIAYADVQNLIVDPLGGVDSLTLTTGVTAYIPYDTNGVPTVRHFFPLVLGVGAKLIASTPDTHADRMLLDFTNAMFSTGWTLQLTSNDAIFTNTPLSIVNGLVTTGYNLPGGGKWNGTSITSFSAASDTTHLTALAVVQNNQSGAPLFTATHLFDGVVPNPGDVLVKYTNVGDANLDGKVDGSDYSLIDAGYAADKAYSAAHPGGTAYPSTGWFNGDFNYDGVVDGSDYALIDNTFNNQRTAYPSAQVASVAAALAAPLTALSKQKALIGPLSLPTANFVPTATFSTTPICWSTPIATTAGAEDAIDRLKLRGAGVGFRRQ
jgi:hypothetical protein